MTALTRRGLIAAFTALSASGGIRINPEAISQIPIGDIPPPAWDTPGPGVDISNYWNKSNEVRQALRQKLRGYESAFRTPTRIAGKRSWSEVYKAGIAEAEYEKLRRLLDSLDSASTGEKILEALLGKST
jgi:hypothetical protein